VGGGRDQLALEQMAMELGIRDRVAFVGFVDNPASYLKRARVFALSSSWEGLPTVVIEALALGCPVVATNCPSGPAELLAEGRGRLVPPGNPQALAAALAKALVQPPKPVDPAWLVQFEVDRAVERYAEILGITLPEVTEPMLAIA
jgi:glycosyltransferase involved in cell wall biosynthesis